MEDAQRHLEPPLSQNVKFALTRFREHVRAGALERAWDEMAAAGNHAAAPPMFWRQLADAADLMGLVERRIEALRAMTQAR